MAFPQYRIPGERLPLASFEEARSMLDRFVDWQTCESALSNADDSVRALALEYLRAFAAEGDPFSQAILDQRPIPPP